MSSGVPFGLRVALAALAALWLGMSLQLDTPRWAAWTVMALALPTRGQIGLKGLWRIGGTLVGILAGLAAVSAFAQAPVAMGLALALWFSLNTYVAGRVPALAAYAASLSGLTAGLIAVASATDPHGAFDRAMARGAEIGLGVACAYVASALGEVLQGGRPGTAARAPALPSSEIVVANAVRTFLVVGAAWTIWTVTAWPAGSSFTLFAGVVAILFSTMPDGDLRARTYLYGCILGQAVGLTVKYVLLGAPTSFELLAIILFPFLLAGGIGMTDARTVPLTLGYNLSFLVAVEPRNPMQYDLSAALNQSVAIFAGVAFGVAAFRIVLPRRIWRVS